MLFLLLAIGAAATSNVFADGEAADPEGGFAALTDEESTLLALPSPGGVAAATGTIDSVLGEADLSLFLSELTTDAHRRLVEGGWAAHPKLMYVVGSPPPPPPPREP